MEIFSLGPMIAVFSVQLITGITEHNTILVYGILRSSLLLLIPVGIFLPGQMEEYIGVINRQLQ